MSSNIPLIHPKEDTNKDMIGNLKTDKQKASDSYFEKPISKDTEKDMALNKLTSLDKSSSSSRTEIEETVTTDTKKDQFHQQVQMIKISKNNNQHK